MYRNIPHTTSCQHENSPSVNLGGIRLHRLILNNLLQETHLDDCLSFLFYVVLV